VRSVRLRKSHNKKLNSGAGSQLLEFALALPFLLVMVVGIIDFGQAYNLKQKLNDAAREGARFAVQLSCADCTQTAPATTQALENSIVSYLTTAGVDVCGLTGTTAPTVGPQAYASWTFTSPQACLGTSTNFTIEIDRGNTFVNSGGAIVPSTQIILNSPYAWTFNRIVGLLPGAGTYQAVSSISSTAVMQN
jgi:Flp pilus assembly protein TadG